MAFNHLAQKQNNNQEQRQHSQQFWPVWSSFLPISQHSNDAQTKQIFLNWFEKSILISGLAIAVVLMLTLVTVRITDDSYQHSLSVVNAKIVRLDNSNSNLHQQISGLQRSSRLKKIAKQNHLKLSGRNVRNVK